MLELNFCEKNKNVMERVPGKSHAVKTKTVIMSILIKFKCISKFLSIEKNGVETMADVFGFSFDEVSYAFGFCAEIKIEHK